MHSSYIRVFGGSGEKVNGFWARGAPNHKLGVAKVNQCPRFRSSPPSNTSNISPVANDLCRVFCGSTVYMQVHSKCLQRFAVPKLLWSKNGFNLSPCLSRRKHWFWSVNEHLCMAKPTSHNVQHIEKYTQHFVSRTEKRGSPLMRA